MSLPWWTRLCARCEDYAIDCHCLDGPVDEVNEPSERCPRCDAVLIPENARQHAYRCDMARQG